MRIILNSGFVTIIMSWLPLYSVMSTWVVVAIDLSVDSVEVIPRASLVVEKPSTFVVVSIEVTALVCASVDSDEN